MNVYIVWDGEELMGIFSTPEGARNITNGAKSRSETNVSIEEFTLDDPTLLPFRQRWYCTLSLDSGETKVAGSYTSMLSPETPIWEISYHRRAAPIEIFAPGWNVNPHLIDAVGGESFLSADDAKELALAGRRIWLDAGKPDQMPTITS